MTTPLHALEGLKVTKAAIVHDYVQLAFGDEIGISIYNKLELSPDARLEDLISKIVLRVEESPNSIEIRFLDGAILAIDLHRQAYRGPEALELNRAGHPPIVWN